MLQALTLIQLLHTSSSVFSDNMKQLTVSTPQHPQTKVLMQILGSTASIAIPSWHLYLWCSPRHMHRCLYAAGLEADPTFAYHIHYVSTIQLHLRSPFIFQHELYSQTPYSAIIIQRILNMHDFEHHHLSQSLILCLYSLFIYSRSPVAESHMIDCYLTSAYSTALFCYDRS